MPKKGKNQEIEFFFITAQNKAKTFVWILKETNCKHYSREDLDMPKKGENQEIEFL